MLIFTTNNRAICVCSSERWHCETLLSYRWTHLTSPRGWTLPSRTEEVSLWKWLLSLRNDRSWIWTACRSAVLPVDGLQRPCRIVCFPHSGSWQVQGGPAYICRDQRKCVFHNMGTLMFIAFVSSPLHQDIYAHLHQLWVSTSSAVTKWMFQSVIHTSVPSKNTVTPSRSH